MFLSPVQDLQRPTHPRLRIRDANDALIVLEAVRLRALHLVERRLNEQERSMFIRSGAVFVWEESDDEYGLKRWTDGRVWGQSRARRPFLFYEEKEPEGSRVSAVGSYRFIESSPKGYPRPTPHPHYPPGKGRSSGLVKQTYSAWVSSGGNGKRRKWHITAYFTSDDLEGLPAPSEDPRLCRITIPSGVYDGDKGKAREFEFEEGQYSSGPHGLKPSTSSSQGSHHPASRPSLTRYYDKRRAEDQRVIQMLNSRHIM